MKFIFCICLFIMLGQCRKAASIEPVPVDPHDSIVPIKYGLTILKDGKNWDASAQAMYYSSGEDLRFRISCVRSLSNNGAERLFINDIPVSKGIYPIEYATKVTQLKNYTPQSFLSVFVDEEQVAGDFAPDTTRKDHFLEIVQFDSIKQTIRGRFQVFMGVVYTDPLWTNHPDSVFFTKGEFFLKIQQ